MAQRSSQIKKEELEESIEFSIVQGCDAGTDSAPLSLETLRVNVPEIELQGPIDFDSDLLFNVFSTGTFESKRQRLFNWESAASSRSNSSGPTVSTDSTRSSYQLHRFSAEEVGLKRKIVEFDSLYETIGKENPPKVAVPSFYQTYCSQQLRRIQSMITGVLHSVISSCFPSSTTTSNKPKAWSTLEETCLIGCAIDMIFRRGSLSGGKDEALRATSASSRNSDPSQTNVGKEKIGWLTVKEIYDLACARFSFLTDCETFEDRSANAMSRHFKVIKSGLKALNSGKNAMENTPLLREMYRIWEEKLNAGKILTCSPTAFADVLLRNG